MKKRCAALAPLLLFLASLLAQAPGTLDPTFGTDGTVVTDFAAGEDRAYAVAVQPDGKILAAGWATSAGIRAVAVVRLLPSGSLDMGFGTNGLFTLDQADNCRAAAVQPDGKILVAGWKGNQFVYVARLLPNGMLDPAFGTGGVAKALPLNTGAGIYAMLLQPDGKIVLAGYADDGTAKSQYLLVRFNADGALDAGFGTAGVQKVSFGTGTGSAWSIGLDVQPDGKLLATGFVVSGSNNYNVSLARFLPNGQLDNTFSTDGLVVTDLGSNSDEGESVLALPDGKIAVLGNTIKSANYVPTLIGYLSDGLLDSGFGNNGLAFFNLALPLGGVLRGIRQPDGKIVGAGFSNGAGLLRFGTDGVPDTGFGSTGVALCNASTLRSAALQPDGKILAAGSKGNDFVVARFLSGLSVGLLDAPSTLAEPLVFPNPLSLSGGPIRLEYELPAASPVRIELLDLQGKNLARLLRAERFSGKNTEALMLPEGLAEGGYLLNIQTEHGYAAVQVVVQR